MHVQIMEFRLKDISTEDYGKLCAELAPGFATVPGLLSKVWLANAADNRYGAIYTWTDQAACEQFTQSGLFRVFDSHPNLKDVSSRDFAVLEGPTRATAGFVETAADNQPNPDGVSTHEVSEGAMVHSSAGGVQELAPTTA